MKRRLKILTTILITFCIIALANNVLAIDIDYYRPGDLNIEGDSPYYTLAGTVISTIRVIAIIVCVAVIVIVGIKIIYGSVEEKAEYKKRFVPIIIGAVFVVGTTTILKALEYNLNIEERYQEEKKQDWQQVHQFLNSFEIDFSLRKSNENYFEEICEKIDDKKESFKHINPAQFADLKESLRRLDKCYEEPIYENTFGNYMITDLVDGGKVETVVSNRVFQMNHAKMYLTEFKNVDKTSYDQLDVIKLSYICINLNDLKALYNLQHEFFWMNDLIVHLDLLANNDILKADYNEIIKQGRWVRAMVEAREKLAETYPDTKKGISELFDSRDRANLDSTVYWLKDCNEKRAWETLEIDQEMKDYLEIYCYYILQIAEKLENGDPDEIAKIEKLI